MATSLAQFARMRAADPTHLSPFAYGAQQLGYRYFGGKMDDITVLTAVVTPVGELPAQPPGGAGVGQYSGGSNGSSSGAGPPASKM